MKNVVLCICCVGLMLVLAACSGALPEDATLEPAITKPKPATRNIYAAVNTSKTATFSFINDEGLSTSYTVTESASWLTITNGASGNLAANQSATVTVRGTCGAAPSQRSATVTVTSTRDVETMRVVLYCSAYNITLIFNSTITEGQKQVFRTAAARWSQLVTGDVADIPPFNKPFNACGANEPAFNSAVDDLVIYAAVTPIDGAGGILGSAGPCYYRTTGGLPIYGTMRFDSADVASLEAGGTFDEVILHEMGHVLGIGSFWQFPPYFNLINYAPTTTTCRNTTTFTTQPGFTGADAKLEYGVLGGSGNVPVENQYGAGTKCAHWDEERFDNELMTGFLGGTSSATVNPLSRMTVGSLKDMGYQVNKNPANPYSIPSCSPACLRQQSDGVDIANREIILAPVGRVGNDGTVEHFKK
jgi:hypothetical protein